MAKKDGFIHVKLEYDEARQSRRDLLASEMNMINIMKSIEKFIAIRSIELKLKTKFYREIKKIFMDIKLLEVNMPQIKIPKPLKHYEEKTSVPVEPVKGKGEDELERQLSEIQRKLKELSY
jgi:hypothetical protein